MCEMNEREERRQKGYEDGCEISGKITIEEQQRLDMCRCTFIRCGGCGHLIHEGFVCTYCGDDKPSR